MLCLALVLVATSARADDDVPPPFPAEMRPEPAPSPPRTSPEPRRENRAFGFGIGLGAGYSHVPSLDKGYGTFLFPPTLSLHVPIVRAVELELWMPVINLVLAATLGDTKFFWGDLFVKWRPSEKTRGFFVEPGIGYQRLSRSPDGGSAIEIPLRIGYEITSPQRRIGLDVSVRPFVEFILPDLPRDGAFAGGIFFEFQAAFYLFR